MKYFTCRMEFKTGVHFGNGMLDDSNYSVPADVLFSAMYIEALKQNLSERLIEAVSKRGLRFSDAFPYAKGVYMIPKPMPYVETGRSTDFEQSKKYRKMDYIPMTQLQAYLQGEMDADKNPMEDFGAFDRRVMVALQQEESRPFRVGVYRYGEGNGLYLLVAYEEERDKELLTGLMKAVGYGGIGGKKSSGLGRFTVVCEKLPQEMENRMQENFERKMLLSVALPQKEEMEKALENAFYMVQKRSGFVASQEYAEEFRKKKDLYVLSAGSTFENVFEGDIYDVSRDGKHPVYRYAMAFFMGV